MQFDVVKNLIYLVTHGSRAYGLNTPESDYDIKGVSMVTEEYLFGYFYHFDQSENNKELHKKYSDKLDTDDIDSVVYGLQKFMKLAADCNPNIIEVLWVDDSDILYTTPEGELLRENKELFLSLKAKHTFSGYAHSQLKRIKTHRSWLLNPPQKKPERKDFGLPEEKQINGSDLGVLKALKDSDYTFDSSVIEIFKKEKTYAQAFQHWKQFLNWKKCRNPVRAELEAKYGYDCKHGSHLIRLMRMGVEILEQGKVLVKRPDAEELLAIKRGQWSYEKLIEDMEKYEIEIEKLYKKNPAKLPKTSRHKELNELCVQLHKMRIK